MHSDSDSELDIAKIRIKVPRLEDDVDFADGRIEIIKRIHLGSGRGSEIYDAKMYDHVNRQEFSIILKTVDEEEFLRTKRVYEAAPMATAIVTMFKQKGRRFIVSEKMPKTLFDLAVKNADFALDFRKLFFLVAETSKLVLHIHKKGVAHLDVKPENIIIDQKDDFFLIDFDKSFVNGLPLPSKGTKEYTSPEMFYYDITKKIYDPFKADIFSLGRTIYALTFSSTDKTGSPEFLNNLNYETSPLTKRFSGLATNIPYIKALLIIIAQCTNSDPEKRPKINDVIAQLIAPSLQK